MFENLLQKVMELNEMPGVDVYLCVNGETQVMALSVRLLYIKTDSFFRDWITR